MRTVALGALGLVLGAGCNQIFGLDPVVLSDAPVFDAVPDANLPSVHLARLTPQLNMNGAPVFQGELGALTPAPRVQYGRIGEALADATGNATGDFFVDYPYAELDAPWRFVYTLAGGVPHEVHWRPTLAKPGFAVAFEMTPADREPVPATTQVSLHPLSPPASWMDPRIYTTNTWTVADSVNVQAANDLRSDYGSSFTREIGGPKRKPDPTKDFFVLLEYGPSGSTCTVARGSATFRYDLSTGTSPDPTQPSFQPNLVVGAGTPTWLLQATNDTVFQFALAEAHGFSMPTTQIPKQQLVTFGPSGGIPLYRHTEPGIGMPVPSGILLAKCSAHPVNELPSFSTATRISFSYIGTVMFTTPMIQLADGPMVAHGVSVSSAQSLGPFTLTFGVSIPYAPNIDGVPVNLSIGGTVAAVPATTAAAELDFSLAVTGASVDMYEATLFRVDANKLVPVREFTFVEKPLRFDRDQGLPADTKFVFQIRAYKGAPPNAASADFRNWSSTQQLASTYTQTFTLAH